MLDKATGMSHNREKKHACRKKEVYKRMGAKGEKTKQHIC